MVLRRCLVLVLITGFWLSFHGRLEPDVTITHDSVAVHGVDGSHRHDHSSNIPATPMGDHKDQHGCYHSHAPFVAVETAFECRAESSALVTAASEIPYSPSLTSILRPPRA